MRVALGAFGIGSYGPRAHEVIRENRAESQVRLLRFRRNFPRTTTKSGCRGAYLARALLGSSFIVFRAAFVPYDNNNNNNNHNHNGGTNDVWKIRLHYWRRTNVLIRSALTIARFRKGATIFDLNSARIDILIKTRYTRVRV